MLTVGPVPLWAIEMIAALLVLVVYAIFAIVNERGRWHD